MAEVAKQKKRLDYVSWIQFIGVMSVIFGHSMNSIAVPEWLHDVKMWVYTYHMPLFFLVSSYLFSYLGGFERHGYKETFKGKFSRLLLPYIIWNVAFFVPKIMMVDYIPETVEWTPEYFFKLFLSPRDNILGHTWFLCALFEMFVLTIALEKIRKNKQLWIPMTLLLVVLNCFGVSERFLAVGDLMKNGIYFWIGLLLGGVRKENLVSYGKSNYTLWSLILLVAVLTCVWIYDSTMLINTQMLGFGVLFLLGALQMKFDIKWLFIEFVSRNAFCIYIIHWPILMVIRLIIYQKMHVAPIPSMLCMLVLGIGISAGIAWILRQFKSPFMNGVKKVVFGM